MADESVRPSNSPDQLVFFEREIGPVAVYALVKRRPSVYYEWSGKKGNKTPHYIYPVDENFIGFAGIFSDLAPEDISSNRSYSIITTKPNKVMEKIHDRMPVILHPSEFNDWLNPDNEDPNYLTDFLRPYPDDGIDEYVVSKAVGNVKNNSECLIQKAD